MDVFTPRIRHLISTALDTQITSKQIRLKLEADFKCDLSDSKSNLKRHIESLVNLPSHLLLEYSLVFNLLEPLLSFMKKPSSYPQVISNLFTYCKRYNLVYESKIKLDSFLKTIFVGFNDFIPIHHAKVYLKCFFIAPVNISDISYKPYKCVKLGNNKMYSRIELLSFIHNYSIQNKLEIRDSSIIIFDEMLRNTFNVL